jgi:hypothetical protein
MIENDEGLETTYEALGHMYRALASLRRTMLNTRQYGLFAEGPIDEIQKLEAEIHAYLGLRQTEEQPAATALHEEPPPYPESK